MKYKVEYNPDFYNDIAQAVEWYNERQNGLGDRFLLNVKKQTAELSTSALSFAIKYEDIRCMKIQKFPFLVHFRIDQPMKIIKVEAILHTSRDPENWKKRL